MTRRDYTDRVQSCLHRLTLEERQDVLAELDAHMEDRICALLDLGYDEALAEERVMAAMGDPEEVGREMDKQYPLRWLILGRAAVVLTVVLCVQAVLGLGILGQAFQSFEARIYPDTASRLEQVDDSWRVDYRAKVGNDVLRVYRVSVGSEGGKPVAEISLCAYDRIPCGIVSEDLLNRAVVKNQRGERLFGSNGRGCWTAEHSNCYVNLEPDDLYVTVEYERFGRRVELVIPLMKEVAP
jgi:hypothetical protein